MVRGIIYAIVSACCLGTVAIFVKTGLAIGMEPTQIVQYRFTFGTLLLFSWFGITNPGMLKIRPKALAKAAVLGIGLYPFQSWTFIKALQYMPASTTSLIYYLYPLMTTLIAVAVFKMRPTRAVFMSLALVLAGCGLVFYNAFSQNVDVRGIGYAMACMTTFSVYLTLVQRFTANDDPRRISIWVVFFMGVAFSCISSPLTILDQPAKGWIVAMGLGLLPTALAVSLIYRAIKKIGSAYTAMFSTIEPITTVVLAHFILGEPMDVIQVCGMLLIVAGIVLPNLALIRQAAPDNEKRQENACG